MAIITTNGQVDSLMASQFSSASDILANVGDKFSYTFGRVYSCLLNDFYILYNESEGFVSGRLNIVNTYVGDFTATGTGFYTSRAKITLLTYSGDDGFIYAARGSMAGHSVSMSEYEATWNNESIDIKGNFPQSGYGKFTSASVTGNGMTWQLEGSLTFSPAISGTLKSISLADENGNSISVKSSFDYASLENSTLADVIGNQSLYAGNDIFNVPDASRAWHGYGGNDKLYGGALADELYGDEGNDKLFGYAGNDALNGGVGNDQLTGGDGDDALVGGDGNDKIVDSTGDNTVIDASGNANVTLGSGNDSVTTGGGNDKITAGEGNNEVSAGAGNDRIVTGSGNDVIRSGAGKDTITDAGGSDLFLFDNIASGGFDTITGFQNLTDTLVFDGTVFTALAGGITVNNLVVASRATALDADDYLLFSTSGGKLYYDADGSGAGAAVQIAALKNVTSLDANSFMLET